MSQSARGRVIMENGVLAEILFRENGTYEVTNYIRKSTLAGPSLKDVGKLIAEMEGDESAGSRGSYARVDLT
jgi:hypothetical protein